MDDFVLTLDLEWAPEFVIDAVASILEEARVRSTWFVTHASPALARLRAAPELFELGVHPNLLPGSDHGATTDDVLAHCMELVPEATALRTHALVQSHALLEAVARRTPLETDLSLFLPRMPHITPVEYALDGGTLLRIPYYWEDDDEILRADPGFDLGRHTGVPGLKVFDFHPVLVYLNASTLTGYRALTRLGRMSERRATDFAPHLEPGPGAGSVFRALVERLAANGRSLRVRDLVERWRSGTGAPA